MAYLGVRDCFLKWSPREIVGVEKYEKRKHMTGKSSGKDPKAERNSALDDAVIRKAGARLTEPCSLY